MKEGEGMMAMAKLGTGGRFKKLKGQLAAKGAKNPGALAAYIGRKKYGAKKMAGWAAKERKKEMPGMSWHTEVNCSKTLKGKTMNIDSVMMKASANPFK